MKRNLFLLASLMLLLSSLYGSPKETMLAKILEKVPETIASLDGDMKRVSVYAIECNDKSVDLNAFQDQLTTVLVETGKFQVIDRKGLKALLEEQKLSLTGLVDTGQMIQAGKLIGVQGFFFGSLDVSKERIIFTLKLVNVETGAIILSKKITVKNTAFLSFGIKAAGGNIAVSEQGASTHVLGGGPSYRQGFEKWEWGYAGLDVVFYKNFPQDQSLTVLCASVSPKLYFRLPVSLFSPYGGLSLEMLLFQPAKMEPTAFAVAPIAGMDINFSDNFVFFVEGKWQLETPLKEGSPVKLTASPVVMGGVAFYLHF
jgi:TolB-like protein